MIPSAPCWHFYKVGAGLVWLPLAVRITIGCVGATHCVCGQACMRRLPSRLIDQTEATKQRTAFGSVWLETISAQALSSKLGPGFCKPRRTHTSLQPAAMASGNKTHHTPPQNSGHSNLEHRCMSARSPRQSLNCIRKTPYPPTLSKNLPGHRTITVSPNNDRVRVCYQPWRLPHVVEPHPGNTHVVESRSNSDPSTL